MTRRASKLAKKSAAQVTCMFTSGEKEMEALVSLNEEGYTLVQYKDCTDAVKATMPDPLIYDLLTKRKRWTVGVAILEKKEDGMTKRYCIAGTILEGTDKKEMENYVKNTRKVDHAYKMFAHMGLNYYTLRTAGRTIPYEPEKPAIVLFEVEEEPTA